MLYKQERNQILCTKISKWSDLKNSNAKITVKAFQMTHLAFFLMEIIGHKCLIIIKNFNTLLTILLSWSDLKKKKKKHPRFSNDPACFIYSFKLEILGHQGLPNNLTYHKKTLSFHF